MVGSQYQRVALVRIVEALQDGDVDVAYAAALGALEDEPPADDPKSRTPCPRPGCAFTGWPGQVAEHVAISHGRLPARTQPPRRIVRAAPGGRT